MRKESEIGIARKDQLSSRESVGVMEEVLLRSRSMKADVEVEEEHVVLVKESQRGDLLGVR